MGKSFIVGVAASIAAVVFFFILDVVLGLRCADAVAEYLGEFVVVAIGVAVFAGGAVFAACSAWYGRKATKAEEEFGQLKERYDQLRSTVAKYDMHESVRIAGKLRDSWGEASK